MALLDRFRRKAMSTQWDDDEGDVGRSEGMGHYIEWVPTEHLRPMLEWDRDENGIPGRTDDVLESLNRVGFKNPVWVDFNPDTGMAHLSEGNHRVTVAIRGGIPAVPVSVIRSGRVPRNQAILRPHKYVGGETDPYDENYTPQYMKPSEIGMPTTEPWDPRQASTRVAMPLVPPKYEAINQHRDAYVGEYPSFPDREQFAFSSPEYQAWLEQKRPEFEAVRQREKEWEHAIRHALSTGRVTPEQAAELGFRASGHEGDSDWGAKPWGKWQPLPPKLYHVTSNLPAVLQSGVLRSPDELDLLGKGRGLGGGTQNTISLTESLDEAQNIKRAMIEGADVASGRLPIERLIEMAKSGEGADKPWLPAIFGTHDWSKGNPQGLDDLLLGRKTFYSHLLPEGHPLKDMASSQSHLPAEEWEKHGYYPREGAYPLGTPGNPDYPRYTAQSVYRNLSPEEKALEAFEWWRNPWAAFRSWAGGPSDPMFTSIDPHWFANLDPSHVGVVETEPVVNGHGYPLSSLGEWRIPTGEAVNIVGHDGQGRTAAAAPDPRLLMEAWHVYNETCQGAPAKSGLPAEQDLMRRMEDHGVQITEPQAKQALLDAMDMWFRGEGEGGAWEGWNANQAIEDTIMDSPHYVPNIGKPTPRQGATEPQRSWHLTDKHDFALDPEYHPENNTTLGGEWPHKGLFIGEPEAWFNGHDYVRPFVAEIEHPPLEAFGGYSGENFLPAEAFPQSTVRRVIPYPQYERETFGGQFTSEIDAPDGDVRGWTPEQVAAYKQKLNEYIKSSRPHMLQSVCDRCGSDYVSPGKPCPRCGFETDWDGNVYSNQRRGNLISFPGPEYLVPGEMYNWWSDKAEPWMKTGEPRNFNPAPHITWARYLGPHRHEDYQRAVPEIPGGHRFEITQGGYDGRAKMVRSTKDDPSDPHAANWEQAHVMDDAQLREIMARGMFSKYYDPAPWTEVADRINMEGEDHQNRMREQEPTTFPEDWEGREGSAPYDARAYVAKSLGGSVVGNDVMLPDGTEIALELGDEPSALHLFGIETDPEGTGAGTRAVRALQQYAEETGREFIVGPVSNQNYWETKWPRKTDLTEAEIEQRGLDNTHSEGMPYYRMGAAPDNRSSVKRAMAERSGFPELDQAIDEFMRSHPDIESYRDPQIAWGQCEALAEECAAFLKQRGFKAYTTTDELGMFPGYENAQDTKEIGAGDFAYPEHAMVEVYGLYGPNNVNNVTIDFTASQYGFTEFPKVHGGPADHQSSVTPSDEGPSVERKSAMTPGQRERARTEYEDTYGPDGTEVVHEFPDGWTVRRLPTYGEVAREGEMMHHCWAQENMTPEEMAKEVPDWNSQYMSLRDPDNWPHASFYHSAGHPMAGGGWIGDAYGHGDQPLKDDYKRRIFQWSQTLHGAPNLDESIMDHGENDEDEPDNGRYGAESPVVPVIPRMEPPTHTYMWHVAPREHRDQITANGLTPRKPDTEQWGDQTDNQPDAVYGWTDPDDAAKWAKVYPWPTDIWQARVPNAQYFLDGKVPGARYVTQPIPAEDVQLHGQRQANILDPIEQTLDPAVFDQPEIPRPRLKPALREWLLDTIYNILEQGGYEGADRWARLYLTGSLTTYQYAGHSDCDISIFVNHHIFPEWSRAEMIGLMVEHCDGLNLPGTPHELQVFVVAKGIEPEDLYQPGLRSGYDLINEEWVVAPERNRSHDVEHDNPEGYATGLMAADKMERLLRYEPDKAITYYGQLHRKRMRDQKDAKGDFSTSNLVYKMLDNRGLFDQLRELGVKIAGEDKMASIWHDLPVGFHVAPRAHRDVIRTNGLKAAAPLVPGGHTGVYLWHDEDTARNWAESDHDVWRVTPPIPHAMRDPNPHYGGAYVYPTDIPADRLELLDDGERIAGVRLSDEVPDHFPEDWVPEPDPNVVPFEQIAQYLRQLPHDQAQTEAEEMARKMIEGKKGEAPPSADRAELDKWTPMFVLFLKKKLLGECGRCGSSHKVIDGTGTLSPDGKPGTLGGVPVGLCAYCRGEEERPPKPRNITRLTESEWGHPVDVEPFRDRVNVKEERAHSDFDQCAQCGRSRSAHRYTEHEREELDAMHRRVDREHGYESPEQHDFSRWQPAGLNPRDNPPPEPIRYHQWVEPPPEQRDGWPQTHEFDRPSLEQAIQNGGGTFKDAYDHDWSLNHDNGIYHFKAVNDNPYSDPGFKVPAEDFHTALASDPQRR